MVENCVADTNKRSTPGDGSPFLFDNTIAP